MRYNFQENISITHAIHYILTTQYDNTCEKLYIGLFFLNLKKTFDTVCHDILLSKRDHYGIRGIALKLMNSYLQRKQYVLLNGVEYKMHCNTYGVPQGSTLDPLLFLTYFNDICNATQSLLRLFADDACFIRDHSNLVSLNNELNVGLAEVVKWCNAKKMTINPNICHCMVILPNSKDKIPNLTMKINNSIIHSSETVKYLGVIIDSKLFFAPHIKYIESKLTRANGTISRLKSTLPKGTLLKLYYALFQPHLLYG